MYIFYNLFKKKIEYFKIIFYDYFVDYFIIFIIYIYISYFYNIIYYEIQFLNQ